jgi:hypothetical protein
VDQAINLFLNKDSRGPSLQRFTIGTLPAASHVTSRPGEEKNEDPAAPIVGITFLEQFGTANPGDEKFGNMPYEEYAAAQKVVASSFYKPYTDLGHRAF